MAAAMSASTFVGKSVVVKTTAAKAARSTTVVSAAAKSWLPGSTPPAYLNGSMVGDFGYDPLRLGKDADALKWYQQAEIIHGRWAMMGLAGMLIPNALTALGAGDFPVWYEAGAKADISFTNAPTLLIVEALLMGWAETKRYYDYVNAGSQGEAGSFLGAEGALAGSGDPAYPGNVFDPLGFSKGENLEELKLKELKNGRLAMFATLGFYAQAYAHGYDGTGPFDDLLTHLADPWHNSVATNDVAIPYLKYL